MKRKKKGKKPTETEIKQKLGKHIKATANFQHLPTRPHESKRKKLTQEAIKRAEREE